MKTLTHWSMSEAEKQKLEDTDVFKIISTNY